MADEAAAAAVEQSDDIVECAICRQVFTDPRELPCIHTYCLKCIKEWCKYKQNGQKGTCPECRKEFNIPKKGIEELPTNIFVAKLLSIKQFAFSRTKPKKCEVCSLPGNLASSDIAATVFCFQCQYSMCEHCHQRHKAFRPQCSSRTVSMKEETKEEDLYPKCPPPLCNSHPDEYVKLYCFDCNAVLCVLCHVECHNGHKCSSINKVSDEFKIDMTKNLGKLSETEDQYKKAMKQLDTEQTQFINQVNAAEDEVCKEAERLKQLIEQHKKTLLEQLSEVKKNRQKEIETVRLELTQNVAMVESFKRYVKEIIGKGTASDVAHISSCLRARFTELLSFDKSQESVDELGSTEVSFMTSDMKLDTKDIGKVVTKNSYKG